MNKYPELRKLMAAHPEKPMSKKELAKIIGKSPSQVTEKLNGKIDFKLSEIIAIVSYFKKYFPDITADKIFLSSW